MEVPVALGRRGEMQEKGVSKTRFPCRKTRKSNALDGPSGRR